MARRWFVHGAEGEPHQPRGLTHAFTRLIRRIEGVPRIRFHDLRHSHATELLLAGVHPKVAQERLGHSTITTTLDLYSHVTDTMQSDAAQRLDAALRPAIDHLAAANGTNISVAIWVARTFRTKTLSLNM